MKSPSPRKTQRSRRYGLRKQLKCCVLKFEALETRTCFSVDLGFDTAQDNYQATTFDAPVTWYFGQSSAEFSLPTRLTTGQYSPLFAYIQRDSSICDSSSDSQSSSDSACDQSLSTQDRPLAQTASGSFVAPEYAATYFLFLKEVANSAPAFDSASDLLTVIPNDSADNRTAEQQSQALSIPENADDELRNASSQQLADALARVQTMAGPKSAISHAALADVRGTIAPVKQITIGEGEINSKPDGPSLTSNRGSESPSPQTSLRDDLPASTVTGYLGNQSNALSTAVRLVATESTIAHIENPARVPLRVNATTDSSLDRAGWVGVFSYDGPLRARTTAFELNDRPQLAPIPRLDSHPAEPGRVFNPLGSSQLTSTWPTSLPLASNRSFTGNRAGSHNLHDAPVIDAPRSSDNQPFESDQMAGVALAEDVSSSTHHRWYLAALPALLFVPRRVRKKLWHATSSKRRPAEPLAPLS